jgi:hypothetical protein
MARHSGHLTQRRAVSTQGTQTLSQRTRARNCALFPLAPLPVSAPVPLSAQLPYSVNAAAARPSTPEDPDLDAFDLGEHTATWRVLAHTQLILKETKSVKFAVLRY